MKKYGFVAFLRKKLTKCLSVSPESYNFAPDFKIKRQRNEESEPT
jgi:hypothetical protein